MRASLLSTVSLTLLLCHVTVVISGPHHKADHVVSVIDQQQEVLTAEESQVVVSSQDLSSGGSVIFINPESRNVTRRNQRSYKISASRLILILSKVCNDEFMTDERLEALLDCNKQPGAKQKLRQCFLSSYENLDEGVTTWQDIRQALCADVIGLPAVGRCMRGSTPTTDASRSIYKDKAACFGRVLEYGDAQQQEVTSTAAPASSTAAPEAAVLSVDSIAISTPDEETSLSNPLTVENGVAEVAPEQNEIVLSDSVASATGADSAPDSAVDLPKPHIQ